jgi:peptidoglycan/LPS O-acetylase OafA/YrhL
MSSPHSDSPKITLRGLDGVRALAALGVLASHTIGSSVRFGLGAHRGIQLANEGVTIFFTLSGFLITYLLLEERRRFDRVHIPQFYMRRILRIWPLYFFFILVACVVHGTVDDGLTNVAYLPLYVVFLPNIVFNLNRYPPDLGHLWSIGVEEQFYAFWPLLVAKVRRLERVLFALIATMLLARAGLKVYETHSHDELPFSIAVSMRFDCMAIGALFAIAYHRRMPRVLAVARTAAVPLAFWVCVALSATNHFSLFSIATPTVMATVTGIFLISEVERTRPVGLLANPVMGFLGRISFGIYVYHPLVISILVLALRHAGVTFQTAWLAVVCVAVITTVVAQLSYALLERPFLRLKERFAFVRSGSPK